MKVLQKQIEEEDNKKLIAIEAKKNISVAYLKAKQDAVGDPLTHFGIMTLNNHIPYKKPILKSMPVFVNAKGVI